MLTIELPPNKFLAINNREHVKISLEIEALARGARLHFRPMENNQKRDAFRQGRIYSRSSDLEGFKVKPSLVLSVRVQFSFRRSVYPKSIANNPGKAGLCITEAWSRKLRVRLQCGDCGECGSVRRGLQIGAMHECRGGGRDRGPLRLALFT